MNDPITQLDVRFLLCPLPVLRCQKALKSLNSGDILVINGTNIDSLDEFRLFEAQNDGFTILKTEKNDNEWHLTIKKR